MWARPQIESLLIWWITVQKGAVEASALKSKCKELLGKKPSQTYAIGLLKAIKKFYPNAKIERAGSGRGMIYSIIEESIEKKFIPKSEVRNEKDVAAKKVTRKKEFHSSEESDLLAYVTQVFLLGNENEMRMPSLQAALIQNSFISFNLSASTVETILKEYSCFKITNHNGISVIKLHEVDKHLFTVNKTHISTWKIADKATLEAFQNIEGLEIKPFMGTESCDLYTISYRDFVYYRDKIIDEIMLTRSAFDIDSSTGVFPLNEEDFNYFKFAVQVAIQRRSLWRQEAKPLDKNNMNTKLANLIFRSGELKIMELM